MPPPQKKTEISKKSGHAEVEFRSAPREILHFNQYSVEKAGEFLQISLWYFDGLNGATPVFRGLMWQTDLKRSIEGLKRYIEKVGAGQDGQHNPGRLPIWSAPPVSVNHIDCVSRDNCSEIVIRSFSHKSVMESAASRVPVAGITHGVYVSDGSIHRKLVVDLIRTFESKK